MFCDSLDRDHVCYVPHHFSCLYATSISCCQKVGRGRRPGDRHTTLTVLPQGFLDKYDYESRVPCVDGSGTLRSSS